MRRGACDWPAGWLQQAHARLALPLLLKRWLRLPRAARTPPAWRQVVTSYSILAAEAGLKNGVCRVDWLRVVLDEAHTIRNPRTQARPAGWPRVPYALAAGWGCNGATEEWW